MISGIYELHTISDADKQSFPCPTSDRCQMLDTETTVCRLESPRAARFHHCPVCLRRLEQHSIKQQCIGEWARLNSASKHLVICSCVARFATSFPLRLLPERQNALRLRGYVSRRIGPKHSVPHFFSPLALKTCLL